MKILRNSICIFFIFSVYSYAQIESFVKTEKKLSNSVQIGMTTSEVTKILGRPKTIEPGFPNDSRLVIKELPEQAGQLNYTTWFYFNKSLKVPTDCAINGIPVDCDLYKEYDTLDVVYFRDGEIISPFMAKSYELLKDKKLKKEKRVYQVLSKTQKVIIEYMPIYCIVFDRGTQVVSNVRAFFQIVK